LLFKTTSEVDEELRYETSLMKKVRTFLPSAFAIKHSSLLDQNNGEKPFQAHSLDNKNTLKNVLDLYPVE